MARGWNPEMFGVDLRSGHDSNISVNSAAIIDDIISDWDACRVSLALNPRKNRPVALKKSHHLR